MSELLNLDFTFENTRDIPDQIINIYDFNRRTIEAQRDSVRSAYSQCNNEVNKVNLYDKEFEKLQFMTKWSCHLYEVSRRGISLFSNSNFVSWCK